LKELFSLGQWVHKLPQFVKKRRMEAPERKEGSPHMRGDRKQTTVKEKS